MKRESGDWNLYPALYKPVEVDFHPDRHPDDGPKIPFEDRMATVHERALQALKDAYDSGRDYVMFCHGHSTSRNGNTTARSVVRRLIRSAAATPYVNRALSIQYHTVFVAAIKRKP